MTNANEPEQRDGGNGDFQYTFTPSDSENGTVSRKAIGVAAAVVLVIVAASVAWLLIDHGNHASRRTRLTPTASKLPSTIGPAAVSPRVLAALVANLGHTVFWAGRKPGTTLEYTKTSNGGVYIRYLPRGVAAGDPRANWLVVATYPYPSAYQTLKAVTKGTRLTVPGGGIALIDPANPQSVHFAYQGIDYQGEVYDPSPTRAQAIAASSDIEPVPLGG